jgi:hypothetical protein
MSPYNRPPRAQRGNRGIALLILNLGVRRGWVVSTTPRPLYPRERPGTHCSYRRLGGPLHRSGRVRKISPPPGFDPRTVHPVVVAIPTELPGSRENDRGRTKYLKRGEYKTGKTRE